MTVDLSELKEYRDLDTRNESKTDQAHTKENEYDESCHLQASLQTSNPDSALTEDKDLNKESARGREELGRKSEGSELKTLNHAGKLCNIILINDNTILFRSKYLG